MSEMLILCRGANDRQMLAINFFIRRYIFYLKYRPVVIRCKFGWTSFTSILFN
jgi:hypothetical protein